MADDEPGGRDRTDALDDALHRIFAAALDLRAASRYVDDRRAAVHIRAAVDLLDAATRDLRIGALDRSPGRRPENEPGANMFVTFHGEEA